MRRHFGRGSNRNQIRESDTPDRPLDKPIFGAIDTLTMDRPVNRVNKMYMHHASRQLFINFQIKSREIAWLWGMFCDTSTRLGFAVSTRTGLDHQSPSSHKGGYHNKTYGISSPFQ